MYRLKQMYPHAVLLTLYQTILYPHFIYGLFVSGSKIENGNLYLPYREYMLQPFEAYINTSKEGTEDCCKSRLYCSF